MKGENLGSKGLNLTLKNPLYPMVMTCFTALRVGSGSEVLKQIWMMDPTNELGY